MPNRLHVQVPAEEERDVALLEDGDEVAELREEVRDGTSLSLPESLSEAEEGEERRVELMREVRRSTEDELYCSRVIVRVSWGRLGRGDLIWEGERERPLGMCSLVRRECLWWLEGVEVEGAWDLDDREGAGGKPLLEGISRMLSLRPVVGSVVDSLAGSWETW